MKKYLCIAMLFIFTVLLLAFSVFAEEIKPGDVNNDGKLTVVDAKYILQSLAGTKELDKAQALAADFNKDGKLSIIDAKWILETAADIRDENGDLLVQRPSKLTISWNPSWQYAEFSAIHSSSVTVYKTASETPKGITVCVNAGHGTKGGEAHYTYCHPDKSPKVTGGSTAEGAIKATSINSGTTMLDGTPEAKVTLSLAKILKDKLLENGYDVLMIRESDDTQLDNIARTVFANNNADCHIALHYDSTENDKGMFYLSVPSSKTYRSMEPVASHYNEHIGLGEAIIQGARNQGVKIFSSGSMEIDLTQTSYSVIPSIDVEVGDRASDYSAYTQGKIADSIVDGIDIFY